VSATRPQTPRPPATAPDDADEQARRIFAAFAEEENRIAWEMDDLGYRWHFEQLFVLDEAKARTLNGRPATRSAVVRLIIALYRGGYSFHTIAEKLNRWQITTATGRQWTAGAVENAGRTNEAERIFCERDNSYTTHPPEVWQRQPSRSTYVRQGRK
jgi:Recombinase